MRSFARSSFPLVRARIHAPPIVMALAAALTIELTLSRAYAQPVSTSGTSISPPEQASGPLLPAAPQAAPAPVRDASREFAVDSRLRMLEARVNMDEQIDSEQAESLGWLKRFKLSGFVQPQFLLQSYNAAASPNASSDGTLPAGIGPNDVTVKPDGTTTNGTFFRIRRARLKTEYQPTDYARMILEIDPAPIGGASQSVGTIARNIEAAAIVPFPGNIMTEYALGIFKLPFGFEVPEHDPDRLWVEHSWAEQNMFPGEFDTGARAQGWLFKRKLQVAFAIVNGITQGEKSFAVVPDVSKGKDVLGRLTYDLGGIASGVSAYYGQGQNLDAANLRFKQFPRWAMNVELVAQHTFVEKLGRTRLIGELTRARNMDRGVNYDFALPAIPLNIGDNVTSRDELGAYVRFEQELSRWVTLGARWDFYSPDLGQRDNGRHTFGFVGAANITNGLRAAIEYDHAIDHVHRAGVPGPSKEYDALSTMLQARF